MSYTKRSIQVISTGAFSPDSSGFQNVSVWQLMRCSAIGLNTVAVWSAELPQDQQPVLCILFLPHPLACFLCMP